jgi:hypothetical protein
LIAERSLALFGNLESFDFDVCPTPPTTSSEVLAANPMRTICATWSAVKPCALMTASSQPAEPQPASSVSARR